MPYVGAPPDGRSASNDEVGIGVAGLGEAGRAGAFLGAVRAGDDRAGLCRGAFFAAFLVLLERGLALLDDAFRAGLLRLGALRFAFFLATVVPPEIRVVERRWDRRGNSSQPRTFVK
jgi:hypothetical protein